MARPGMTDLSEAHLTHACCEVVISMPRPGTLHAHLCDPAGYFACLFLWVLCMLTFVTRPGTLRACFCVPAGYSHAHLYYTAGYSHARHCDPAGYARLCDPGRALPCSPSLPSRVLCMPTFVTQPGTPMPIFISQPGTPMPIIVTQPGAPMHTFTTQPYLETAHHYCPAGYFTCPSL